MTVVVPDMHIYFFIGNILEQVGDQGWDNANANAFFFQIMPINE
jgi:hypothetical protein